MKSSAKSPHPVDVYVGLRLRALRTQRRLSQTALADNLGITFQQIQKYERGANRISASKLLEMAEFLEVSIVYFFEGAPGSRHSQAGAPPMETDAYGRLMRVDGGSRLAEHFPQIQSPGIRRAILKVVTTLSQSEPARRDLNSVEVPGPDPQGLSLNRLCPAGRPVLRGAARVRRR
jgi:transcriptional regulator with XRE-family HTH domain